MAGFRPVLSQARKAVARKRLSFKAMLKRFGGGFVVAVAALTHALLALYAPLLL